MWPMYMYRSLASQTFARKRFTCEGLARETTCTVLPLQPQLSLKRQDSDFDLEEEGQGVPCEEGEDKKLEEMWSRKVRRRSSQLKRLVGDYLDLKEHPKITFATS